MSIYGQRYHATHSNIEETDFSKIDLPRLHEEIQKIKAKTFSFSQSFSPEINDLERLKTFYLAPEVKLGTTCNDLFTNIMIKSDGSAIPAHGRCYNVSMGNIYESTLKEIWHGGPLCAVQERAR